ncbi:uncharacterized protein LOC142574155 isoform X1 [Dermacentor variabilis]|uniref:uncharacterized protein LOC142574155 isoform X1 n=1 Tax=Dermacentor variabilis TaxID=34621 RepID=UPI003F5C9BFA
MRYIVLDLDEQRLPVRAFESGPLQRCIKNTCKLSGGSHCNRVKKRSTLKSLGVVADHSVTTTVSWLTGIPPWSLRMFATTPLQIGPITDFPDPTGTRRRPEFTMASETVPTEPTFPTTSEMFPQPLHDPDLDVFRWLNGCGSKDCWDVINRLEELLKGQVDPCLDFNAFVCNVAPRSRRLAQPTTQQRDWEVIRYSVKTFAHYSVAHPRMEISTRSYFGTSDERAYPTAHLFVRPSVGRSIGRYS